MRALTWQGRRDVRVETVPDPRDPGARPTRSSGSRRARSAARTCTCTRCSGRSCSPGTSSATSRWASSRRSAPRSPTSSRATGSSSRSTSPAARAGCASAGCSRSARRRRSASRARARRCSATPRCTARCRAGRPSTCGCRRRTSGPIKVPESTPDEQFLFLSDVLPTAWQAVQYADVPEGGTLAVLGLGPIGQMASRIGRHLGADRVIGVDSVDARLQMAARHGVEAARHARRRRRGRGADRADRRPRTGRGHRRRRHGGARLGPGYAGKVAQAAVGAAAGRGRPAAHRQAGGRPARRAATPRSRRSAAAAPCRSVGVYGGEVDPMPMMEMFDRGIQLRMGQAHVKRWIDDILPLVTDAADPLGVLDLTTHQVSLDEAPHMYEVVPEEAGRLRQGRAQAVTPTLPGRLGRRDHRRLERHRSRHRARARRPTARRLVLSARSGTVTGGSRRPSAGRPGSRGASPSSPTSSRRSDVVRVRDAAVQRFGRVDGWVHTAAVVAYGRFEDVPPAVFRRVLDTGAARDGARRTGGSRAVPGAGPRHAGRSPARCSARSRRRT